MKQKGTLNNSTAVRLGLGADLRLAPAKTPSIADALILKDGDLFFVTKPNGDVPIDQIHATGLYYHDCRFLDGYELRIAGHALEMLVSTAARGYQSLVELTNPELISADGTVIAPLETIGVKWTRTLDCATLSLYDTLLIRNFSRNTVSLPVSLSFRAGFQDVFAVRALDATVPGKLLPPRVEGSKLQFEYHGRDGIRREVTVTFAQNPDVWEGTTATFLVDLPARGERQIALVVSIRETALDGVATGGTCEATDGTSWIAIRPVMDHDQLTAAHVQAVDQWRDGQTKVKSSSLLLDAIVERSFRDLYLLRSSAEGEEYYAAGVPWFATLFGRDSIISALQTLAYDPRIARQTLRLLAAFQGTKVDTWREEQPGKILHELRVGELARIGQVPHSPYYGSIDATPLFLVLAAEYFFWTADAQTIRHLQPNIEAALQWILDNENEQGYLAYQGTNSAGGLQNQGWKDSDNGVPDVDGSPAEPPIALVEVQSYVYLAYRRLAEMFRRLGEGDYAAELDRRADQLRDRFNRDFWIESRGCYALALQRDGQPVKVCSSNAGHALWAEIAPLDFARRTKKRLMRPDMFTGWGIRTLSEHETAYSPVGYHVGTVWPHDNSLIAAGFRRYGFDRAALRLFSGLMRAAMHFELYRLPELFAGYSQADYEVPVHYPLASKPQAWAAGAIPYMLTELLGLRPEADCHRLNVVSPVLPDFVDRIELQDLSIGEQRVDLLFERTSTRVAVEVRRKDRPLEVVVKL
ncbi:MAG: amylo-alpha-1,6-glucosidase [Thermoleophilia bacterium]|nr:amylo-alpha-1,6-glucosidase [Thermoleophilia bacterium]